MPVPYSNLRCAYTDAGLAARWTLIDVGLAGGNGLGIRPATGKAALTALRLRQDGVDLFGDRVALDAKANGAIAQQQAEQTG